MFFVSHDGRGSAILRCRIVPALAHVDLPVFSVYCVFSLCINHIFKLVKNLDTGSTSTGVGARSLCLREFATKESLLDATDDLV